MAKSGNKLAVIGAAMPDLLLNGRFFLQVSHVFVTATEWTLTTRTPNKNGTIARELDRCSQFHWPQSDLPHSLLFEGFYRSILIVTDIEDSGKLRNL